MKTRAAALLPPLAAAPASAQLTIHLTFDSSVTSNPNSAAIQAACNYVAAELQNNYTNAVTININVVAAAGTSVFGQSTTALIGTYTYTQVRGFLAAASFTPDDATALASLPVADPTGGGTFWLPTALAKALGQRSATNPSLDGTFTLGAGNPFNYSTTNRAVSGQFDFVGVVEHEFTEIMGRIAGDDSAHMETYDLFRFSAANTHNFSTSASGLYFSVNNGVTSLRVFNSNAGGDRGDWNSATPDACNAFMTAGTLHAFSETDYKVMDVIGYRRSLCYPNCDHSTAAPILNVNDFTCFLNKFTAGDPYANCDGSTAAPVLNINDFICFLNKFAAGCS